MDRHPPLAHRAESGGRNEGHAAIVPRDDPGQGEAIVPRLARALAATALATAGAASAQDTVALHFEHAGKKFAININQTLVVVLPRNPSTGFRWQLVEPPNPALKADGLPAYTPPGDAKKVGAGGMETWTFKPVRSGLQELRFEYRRPWDKNAKPERVALYRITVR